LSFSPDEPSFIRDTFQGTVHRRVLPITSHHITHTQANNLADKSRLKHAIIAQLPRLRLRIPSTRRQDPRCRRRQLRRGGTAHHGRVRHLDESAAGCEGCA
jgi:hypothetical protein